MLGDRLRSVKFKNYAMAQLHDSVEHSPITPADVKHACKYSAADSKLRKFLLGYVARHFSDFVRVVGTTEEWDEIIGEYADARSFLLRGFRMSVNNKDTGNIKGKEEYMETGEEERAAHVRAKDGQKISLGKRNADGVLVKREPIES
jgi:hypothetical protein